MVARRFLAVFHPAARFERTVVETRCAEHLFRSRGQGDDRGRLARRLRRVGREPGAAGADGPRRPPPRATTRPSSRCRPSTVGQAVTCTAAEALAKRTKPPGRYSEGTLLRAMETAGKLVEDDEAAEAMKDAGIGTPATRAATIERLVDAEYIEREGRSLRATEKGVGLITMLGDHVLTSPELTGRWEQRLNRIERGEEQAARTSAHEIDGFTREVVAWFADKERGDLRDRARRRSPPAPPRAARARSSSTPRATAATRTTARTTRAAATRSGSSRTGARSPATRPSSTSPPGARARTSRASARSSAPCPTPGCGGEIVERTAQLRLHELEEPLRAGLRLRHLEEGARPEGRGRRRDRPPDGGRAARPTPRRSPPKEPLGRLPHAGLRRRRSSRTAAPTAARAGRAARTPAAASSSGSARRATR